MRDFCRTSLHPNAYYKGLYEDRPTRIRACRTPEPIKTNRIKNSRTPEQTMILLIVGFRHVAEETDESAVSPQGSTKRVSRPEPNPFLWKGEDHRFCVPLLVFQLTPAGRFSSTVWNDTITLQEQQQHTVLMAVLKEIVPIVFRSTISERESLKRINK